MTQASLPFAGNDRKVDELLLFCDGGSRGNPGPAAIGAVVYDAGTDPPCLTDYVVRQHAILTAGLPLPRLGPPHATTRFQRSGSERT